MGSKLYSPMLSALTIVTLPLGYIAAPHHAAMPGRNWHAAYSAAVPAGCLCRGRWPLLCCDDDLQRILDELDDDDDDDGYDEMTAAELALASKLEQAIIGQMYARTADEQAYLREGEPLPYSASTTGACAAAELAAAGIVQLRGALSVATAVELREFIVKELEAAKSADAKQYAALRAAAAAAKAVLGIELPISTENGSFSKVLAPDGEAAAQSGSSSPATAARWDLRLPMAPIVRKGLRELFCDGSPLGDALDLAAGGSQAALWELAALISSPGAKAQIVHADTKWSSKAHTQCPHL